ncbi:hypothetical protein NE237_025871 [Protea cynaroides]|uniref:Uncharacterized protein n=1 Tax=Protea cynaroides TaxID=273540 RepID=A0A9Q0K1R3_9MAGN|nr:hypothetical protein NE237_025871 [Protea cynaroides]
MIKLSPVMDLGIFEVFDTQVCIEIEDDGDRVLSDKIEMAVARNNKKKKNREFVGLEEKPEERELRKLGFVAALTVMPVKPYWKNRSEMTSSTPLRSPIASSSLRSSFRVPPAAPDWLPLSHSIGIMGQLLIGYPLIAINAYTSEKM